MFFNVLGDFIELVNRGIEKFSGAWYEKTIHVELNSHDHDDVKKYMK